MSFGLIERSRIYGRIALNTLRVVYSHNIQKFIMLIQALKFCR
jgi:hypothetical protein